MVSRFAIKALEVRGKGPLPPDQGASLGWVYGGGEGTCGRTRAGGSKDCKRRAGAYQRTCGAQYEGVALSAPHPGSARGSARGPSSRRNWCAPSCWGAPLAGSGEMGCSSEWMGGGGSSRWRPRSVGASEGVLGGKRACELADRPCCRQRGGRRPGTGAGPQGSRGTPSKRRGQIRAAFKGRRGRICAATCADEPRALRF